MSGRVKYWCLKCGKPTAEKRDDFMGWDGHCSNCGMIAQGHVGGAVEQGSRLKCEECSAPSTHRVNGLNLCDAHDFRSLR